MTRSRLRGTRAYGVSKLFWYLEAILCRVFDPGWWCSLAFAPAIGALRGRGACDSSDTYVCGIPCGHTYSVAVSGVADFASSDSDQQVLSKLSRSADRKRICCEVSRSRIVIGPPQLGHAQIVGTGLLAG